MTKFLSIFTGSAGLWPVVIGLVVALGIGGAGGYAARGVIDAPKLSAEQTATANANLATQKCVAQHEAGRADSAEQAVTALTGAAADVTAATNALNAAAGKRDDATRNFLKELSNAPVTKTCGSSAAELAYRNSVVGVRAPSAPAASAP